MSDAFDRIADQERERDGPPPAAADAILPLLTAQELATAEELSGSIWWQRAAAYQSSLYRVLKAYKALAAALAEKDRRVAELEREIIHPNHALWDRLTPPSRQT